MNYFQRLWTKLDRSSKLNLLFIDIAIGALLVFILALCISRHETDSIILMSVSIPVFLIGIPLMFGSTRLKEIEKWEKEEAKDRQDFLNDEDGYLDNMAARVITEIEFRMELKELTIKQKRKFVNKILYKIVSKF